MHRLQCAVLPFANLVAALDTAPADRPFITFWIDEDECETVTFKDFRDRARVEAAHLRGQGLMAGDRVVVIMQQGIPAMATFVAAMMLGAVPAFLAYPNFKIEPSKYRAGLSGVSANLGARAIVIDRNFPEEMLESVSISSGAKLLRSGVQPAGNQQETELQREISRLKPEHLAFIQHSAGTTGLQKGVALSHAAVLRQLEHLAGALKLDSNSDRIYSWLPLYHDMGLIACFMLPMVFHIPLVMQSPMDWVMRPETMLQIIDGHKCTLAWMPNFAFQFVPRRTPRDRWAEYDLSSLRALINCSEPVRAGSMKEFQSAFNLNPRVLQASYAMAENVFAVTQSGVETAAPVTIHLDAKHFRAGHRVVPAEKGTVGAIEFASSGQLLPGQQVRILSDTGALVAEDFAGEIAIRGDCLFDGYYNRPDLTAEAFVEGWYRTGDLGFLKDGELYVVGRKKDLLIVGGENFYPQDIEEIVSAHPAIHDGRVIAMGLYNPDLGTEDIVIVAEVEDETLLASSVELEMDIRSRITASLGLAPRMILLKPPRWIIKSTAGKPARSDTRAKLLKEHPELDREP
jgi:fatty-acyl-CoA synthase